VLESRKLIHDINSNLWALSNGISLLQEKMHDDPEATNKVLGLTSDKIAQLIESWDELKKKIDEVP
jgi:hypothetical protein